MTRPVIAVVLAACLAALAGLVWLVVPGTGEPVAYKAPGFSRLTAAELGDNAFRVAPKLLAAVHDAYAAEDAEGTRTRLAEVASGTALERLYAARTGPLADGGLTGPDQELHEIELVRLDTLRSGRSLRMDVAWRVLGVAPGDGHTHIRGDLYTADLVLKPVDGAWRVTEFDLRDVDPSGAGTAAAAPRPAPEPGQAAAPQMAPSAAGSDG